MRLEPIHQPADDDRADRAADLEHRRDERGVGERRPGRLLNQRRHPVRQEVDDQQAHEEREPQQQRAEQEPAAEQLPHRRDACDAAAPTNVAPRKSAAGAIRRSTPATRSCGVALRAPDSAPTPAAPTRGPAPAAAAPRRRRPAARASRSAGATCAAMRPPSAEPIVKPQNISVTSDDRRAVGTVLGREVMVVGIAPPRPTPVRNRSQVSDGRPLLERRHQAGRAETPPSTRPASSCGRGDRPADRRRTRRPSGRRGRRRTAGRGWTTASPHSARMAGAMKPMMAVSKPSMATTRKQSSKQQPLHRRQRLGVDERLDVDDRGALTRHADQSPSTSSASAASAILARRRTSVFASRGRERRQQPLLDAANAGLDLLQDLPAGRRRASAA